MRLWMQVTMDRYWRMAQLFSHQSQADPYLLTTKQAAAACSPAFLHWHAELVRSELLIEVAILSQTSKLLAVMATNSMELLGWMSMVLLEVDIWDRCCGWAVGSSRLAHPSATSKLEREAYLPCSCSPVPKIPNEATEYRKIHCCLSETSAESF